MIARIFAAVLIALLALSVPGASSQGTPDGDGQDFVILEDRAGDAPVSSANDVVRLLASEDETGLTLTIRLAGSSRQPAGTIYYDVSWRVHGHDEHRNVRAGLGTTGSIDCQHAFVCAVDLPNREVRFLIPYEARWDLGCASFLCFFEAFFPDDRMADFAVEVWQAEALGVICHDRAPDENPPLCSGREGTRAGNYTLRQEGDSSGTYDARLTFSVGEWRLEHGFSYRLDVDVSNQGDERAYLNVTADPPLDWYGLRIASSPSPVKPHQTRTLRFEWGGKDPPPRAHVRVEANPCGLSFACDPPRVSHYEFWLPAAPSALTRHSTPLTLDVTAVAVGTALLTFRRFYHNTHSSDSPILVDRR